MSVFRPLLSVLLLSGVAPAFAADCGEGAASPVVDMYVAAPEMRTALAVPVRECTLAQEVIERARADARAMTAGPAPAAAPTNVSAAGYVPKTQYDNTPWRFDMNQNGKRMTAEEFDAWMKAKGIRVATGKPAAVSATPATTDSATPSAGASTP